jgi:hypothetical protein
VHSGPKHDAVDLEQPGEVAEVVRYQGAQLESAAAIELERLLDAWCTVIESLTRELALPAHKIAQARAGARRDAEIGARGVEL